jgi:hypothetical protein
MLQIPTPFAIAIDFSVSLACTVTRVPVICSLTMTRVSAAEVAEVERMKIAKVVGVKVAVGISVVFTAVEFSNWRRVRWRGGCGCGCGCGGVSEENS